MVELRCSVLCWDDEVDVEWGDVACLGSKVKEALELLELLVDQIRRDVETSVAALQMARGKLHG